MRSIVRASVLAGASVLAVSTAPGFAASTHPVIQSPHAKAHGVMRKGTDRTLSVLYDQTSNPSGAGTFSQSLGGGNNANSAAADDFIVPDGQTWIVKEIDVSGMYFNSNGPATAESVTFYRDKNGSVGKVVAERGSLDGADDNGNFAIALGEGVKLKSGHYWVSVAANLSFKTGDWAWQNQTAGTSEGDPAMWENPGGSVCQTWTPQHDCGGTLGDQVFTLKGNVK